MSKLRFPFLIALFVFLCWLAYALLLGYLTEPKESEEPIFPDPVPQLKGDSIEGQSLSERDAVIGGEEASSRTVSYQEIQIVDYWLKASGLNMEQVEDYKNQYTDSQLLTMGRNGDIVAYQALISRRIHNAWKVGDFDFSRLSAERFSENREAFDRAYQEMLKATAASEAYRKETQGYMDEAIAAGSVYEISARARSVLKQPSPDDNSEQRAEALQSLREEFAYFELYSLRGADGVRSVESAKKRDLQKFRDAYGLDEPLTAEDYAWIQDRAQRLYQKYQKMRRDMGFGEFDNTMPPEVNEFLNGPFDS